MTGLRDEFDVVHRREGKFDYVTWSQVADRLDDTGEAWSFAIIGMGDDWVHGRLNIGDRHFENVGYAENASADWKKEALKDAASDSFKRCAALAGVARYLYDKDDSGAASRGPSQTAPARQERTTAARPHRVDTGLDESEDEANPFDEPTPIRTSGQRDSYITCPEHGVQWAGEPGDLWHKTDDPNLRGYCRHPENVKKVRAR